MDNLNKFDEQGIFSDDDIQNMEREQIVESTDENINYENLVEDGVQEAAPE